MRLRRDLRGAQWTLASVSRGSSQARAKRLGTLCSPQLNQNIPEAAHAVTHWRLPWTIMAVHSGIRAHPKSGSSLTTNYVRGGFCERHSSLCLDKCRQRAYLDHVRQTRLECRVSTCPLSAFSIRHGREGVSNKPVTTPDKPCFVRA